MAHKLPIRIYYEDTDAGGVIYYGNYLKFVERGRTEWLRELGINQSQLREETGLFFVVRHCEADYLAPGHLDDELVVETHLQQLGNASISMVQNVIRPRDDTLLAIVKVTVVCINEKLKAARIPQHIRELIEKES